jgi:hypothetical protein
MKKKVKGIAVRLALSCHVNCTALHHLLRLYIEKHIRQEWEQK